MQIQESVPLAPLTTFGIGGPARFFARVKTVADLHRTLAFAKEKELKVFILGGGSNILINDAGFDGLVIKIEFGGVDIVRESGAALVVAAAGESWDKLVERLVQEELWGVENLSGIPGTVGGAVVQNIGAYGAVLSQTLEWVEVFDLLDERRKTLTKEVCKFEYRDSLFKQESAKYVILNAAFSLVETSNPNLTYKDLAERFKATTPSPAEIRTAVLDIRKNKFPDTGVEGTAGSFFKNPVVPPDEAKKLTARYPNMPVFVLPESPNIKISLAWLLDYRHGVLDMRNVRVGGARMFEKQFLVIAAEKNTTARDVKQLAKIVQEKVFVACGITVEPEVLFVV